jgi:hypothetical protein
MTWPPQDYSLSHSMAVAPDQLTTQQLWCWQTLSPFFTALEYDTVRRCSRSCYTALTSPTCCQILLDRLFLTSHTHCQYLTQHRITAVEMMRRVLGPLVAVQRRCLRLHEPTALHRQLWWECLLYSNQTSKDLALIQSVKGVGLIEPWTNDPFLHYFTQDGPWDVHLKCPQSWLQLWMNYGYHPTAFPSLLGRLSFWDNWYPPGREALTLIDQRTLWIAGYYADGKHSPQAPLAHQPSEPPSAVLIFLCAVGEQSTVQHSVTILVDMSGSKRMQQQKADMW